MLSRIIVASLFVLWSNSHRSDAQFAYPLDPNPPQVETTFNCFACEGDGCDETRVSGVHEETSCTGPRVACWTIKNTETSMYTRTCEQPPSIRQGVFCNRHMEGKEFCFASDTPRGRVRLCGKCCLSDRCNDDSLREIPDSTLQTCVACRGDREEICNTELPLSIENSTYVEQCLLPNSDCWTERQTDESNRIIFQRGCQLLTCNEENTEEVCSITNGRESCQKCCKGKLCNRFGNTARSLLPSRGMLFAVLLYLIVQLHFALFL